MRVTQPFGGLLICHGAHKRLGGGAINAVGNFQQTGNRHKTTLAIEAGTAAAVAAEKAEAEQRKPK